MRPLKVSVYLQAEINQQQGSCATPNHWAMREVRMSIYRPQTPAWECGLRCSSIAYSET